MITSFFTRKGEPAAEKAAPSATAKKAEVVLQPKLEDTAIVEPVKAETGDGVPVPAFDSSQYLARLSCGNRPQEAA